jgi:hypothetical protein
VAIRGFDEKRRGKAGFFLCRFRGDTQLLVTSHRPHSAHVVSRRRHALMTLNVAAMPRHEYDEWR